MLRVFDMPQESTTTAMSPTPGAALRSFRTMAGLTLKDVADGADTSIAYLSKVERDEFQPTQRYVAKVAAFIADQVMQSSAASERAA